jgi:hypothetical protein
MNAMSLKKMVVVLVLVGVLAGFAQADKLELQAKLSKEIKIQLKDVTIVEALEEIGEKAGLEIVLSDEWKLFCLMRRCGSYHREGRRGFE